MAVNSDKQQLEKSPAAYHGITMWWLAVVVIAGGAIMSFMKIGDSNWLSRSGCLVAMLGIWSGLGGLIREKILNKRLAMRHIRAKRRLRNKYRGNPVALEEELEHLEKRFNDLEDKHHSKLKLSVGLQEATLLLAGTFFWGFGDLIKYFI